MAIQTVVNQNPDRQREGTIADCGFNDKLSGLLSTRKLLSVAIAASNDQVYTININGVPAVYTADGSATTAEIAAGLVAAINLTSQAGVVTASGADTPILIESDIDGAAGDFTYSDSAGTGTLTETVLVAQGGSLAVGKGVCLDERRPIVALEEQTYPIRLPRVSADVTGGRFLGVIVEEFDDEQLPATAAAYATAVSIAPYQCLNVLHKGRCIVKVEEAVVRGDQAFCRYATGGLGIGSFRKSTGTSEAAAVPNAKFLTSANANGLAVLEMS